MAVLRLRKAAEESGMGESTIAIESGCISAELTEDGGAPNVSSGEGLVPAAGWAAEGELRAAAAERTGRFSARGI